MSRCCGLFSGLLELISRHDFQQAVKKILAQRHGRGFTCWGQIVAMFFCHLEEAHFLRQIIRSLRSCEGELKHLSIAALNRYALAYANGQRPWFVYQKLLRIFLHRLRDGGIERKKTRFRSNFISLYSAIIDLWRGLFNRAHLLRTKGAIKLHILLSHDGHPPTFAWITESKVAGIEIARQIGFPPGTILIDDPAYNDYCLLAQWISQQVLFVAKIKENALPEIIGELGIPKNRNIRKYELDQITGYGAPEKCPAPLRRIKVCDPEIEEVHGSLTNSIDFGATTIPAIYRNRWQI